MPTCVKIRGKRRQLCIGDLDRLIEIQIRGITAPKNNNFDYDESFLTSLQVFAMVETSRGVAIFDATNIERLLTHLFYIRFQPDLDINTWVNYNNVRYDILDVENLDERSEYILLRTTNRGPDTQENTKV